MAFTKAVLLSTLPPGGRKIIEIKGVEIALFHRDEGVTAVSNICPHSGGALGEGLLTDGDIVCPLHFWRFKLDSGRSVRPQGYWIKRFPVKLENGWIYLDLPEEEVDR